MTYETRHPRIGDVITDGEEFARVYSEPEFIEPLANEEGWWLDREGFESGWWRCEVSALDEDVEGGIIWVWCEEDSVEVVDE